MVVKFEEMSAEEIERFLYDRPIITWGGEATLGESWKLLEGFGDRYNIYAVSDQGRISSFNSFCRDISLVPTHSQFTTELHYIDNRGKSKTSLQLTANLVLTAFVRPGDNLERAIHRDWDNRNNKLSNLYWYTPEYKKHLDDI